MPRKPTVAKATHLLEDALRAMHHGVLITDSRRTESEAVYCNPALEELTGYSAAEMLGHPGLIPDDSEPDGGFRRVARIPRKDGSTFWGEITCSSIRDAEGRPTHEVRVVWDITAAKDAENSRCAAHRRLEAAYARECRITETLQDNELQLADLLESISDSFFALDRDWRFIYLNRQAEALLRANRDALLGQVLWEKFPGMCGSELEEQLRRAATEQSLLGCTEYYAPHMAWWDVRISPTPEGLTVFLRDVTEHQQAEEERRKVQERQRAFLRDVLASVTEGKLRLCHTPEELPPLLTLVGEPVLLTQTEGLAELRHLADHTGMQSGLSESRRADLELSVGEAAMNAVVHAGAGIGQVSVNEKGTVQVRIEDHGKGIAVENLPKATLERGYTTAGTLGHGMKIMLEALDRLWLLTGPAGTTVVMERDRKPPESESH